ncbi:co-regulatory protein PtrA N-terminal domain-containing protein, partial [Pseudomonas chlororaphis]
MKLFKLSIAALLLSISSLAMADGGGDRTFDRAMQANEKAMAAYA